MRICDRCNPKLVPATESFNMMLSGEVIELCEKCTNETLMFIHKPPTTKKKGFFGIGGEKDSVRAEA